MRDPERQVRHAERSVLAAFVVSTLGAIGFVVAYGLDAGTGWIGATLAIAFAGLGYGLIAWGHTLMPGGGAVETREPMSSSRAEEREAGAFLRERGRRIGRRGLLGRALAVALGATGLAALVPAASLGSRRTGVLRHTAWSAPGSGRLVTADGRPVAADELDVGGVLTVFPEGHHGAADAQTLLIRLGSDDVRPPARADWIAAGHVAYSKICTHAGCPVGLYEVADQTLFCPCHQSAFDVVEGATPTLGPATRALPQLPLGVDADGWLVATDDFAEAVGPGWWTRP